MSFQFATCNRIRALGFIQADRPNVTDTPESAGPILDLIEADLIRVVDPDCHTGGVVPGKKWDESRRDEVFTLCGLIFGKEGGA